MGSELAVFGPRASQFLIDKSIGFLRFKKKILAFLPELTLFRLPNLECAGHERLEVLFGCSLGSCAVVAADSAADAQNLAAYQVSGRVQTHDKAGGGFAGFRDLIPAARRFDSR